MRIAILHATKYGHAARVGQTIAQIASREGAAAEAFDLKNLPHEFSLAHFDAAILVGGIHFGRYPRPLVRFVERNLAALSGMHSAFVSISGAAITEDGRPEAEQCIEKFVRRAGWVPDRRGNFGGAVNYTKYGFLIRFMMKRISRDHQRSTNTSRDHDYTDWTAVDAFVRDFVEDVLSVSSSPAVASALA